MTEKQRPTPSVPIFDSVNGAAKLQPTASLKESFNGAASLQPAASQPAAQPGHYGAAAGTYPGSSSPNANTKSTASRYQMRPNPSLKRCTI